MYFLSILYIFDNLKSDFFYFRYSNSVFFCRTTRITYRVRRKTRRDIFIIIIRAQKVRVTILTKIPKMFYVYQRLDYA